MNESDSAAALEQAIARYNDAWNAHDLDAIMAMHAPDMVFHNHTAGRERGGRGGARAHRLDLRDAGPTSASTTRRLYVRDGLVVQEWTATATHTQHDAPRRHRRRADRQARSSGTAWT